METQQMIRADFYLLSSESIQERFLFACRIIEKAYQQDQSLYVHTSSQSEAAYFNELLWTYRDNSFIPHVLANEKSTLPVSITIGYDTEHYLQYNNAAILLLLTNELPDCFNQFSRIIEIIPNEITIKTAARQHYRTLQQHNIEIHTHKI